MPNTIGGITTWRVFVGLILTIEFFSTLIILFVCRKSRMFELKTSTKEALILTSLYVLIMALSSGGLPNWELPIFWFGLIVVFPALVIGSLMYKKIFSY